MRREYAIIVENMMSEQKKDLHPSEEGKRKLNQLVEEMKEKGKKKFLLRKTLCQPIM
jgi:hypothetical protein